MKSEKQKEISEEDKFKKALSTITAIIGLVTVVASILLCLFCVFKMFSIGTSGTNISQGLQAEEVVGRTLADINERTVKDKIEEVDSVKPGVIVLNDDGTVKSETDEEKSYYLHDLYGATKRVVLDASLEDIIKHTNVLNSKSYGVTGSSRALKSYNSMIKMPISTRIFFKDSYNSCTNKFRENGSITLESIYDSDVLKSYFEAYHLDQAEQLNDLLNTTHFIKYDPDASSPVDLIKTKYGNRTAYCFLVAYYCAVNNIPFDFVIYQDELGQLQIKGKDGKVIKYIPDKNTTFPTELLTK